MLLNKIIYYLLILIIISTNILADDYLNTYEVTIISISSIGFEGVGHLLTREINSASNSIIRGPLPLDRSIQKLIGGECKLGKRNFLDSRFGGVYTPVAGAIILAIANLSWSQEQTDKIFLQDMFLYTSGLITTMGITGMAKGIFKRERPLPFLCKELAIKRETYDYSFDHQSFFSGHTSSAFFSMTYLNLRIRSIMRYKLTSSEFDRYHWLLPLLFYSWSSFVGLSRVHAYKHFFSDVLAGAITGYLIGKFFYSINNQINNQDSLPSSMSIIKIKVKI